MKTGTHGKTPQKILRVVQYDKQAKELEGTEEFWVVDTYSTNISKRCRTFEEAIEWTTPSINKNSLT